MLYDEGLYLPRDGVIFRQLYAAVQAFPSQTLVLTELLQNTTEGQILNDFAHYLVVQGLKRTRL